MQTLPLIALTLGFVSLIACDRSIVMHSRIDSTYSQWLDVPEPVEIDQQLIDAGRVEKMK